MSILLDAILRTAINPALGMLPAKMDTDAARVMLLAIGLQESRFEHRRQMGNGPARGFWQFEKGGGVKGCVQHPSSAHHLRQLCAARGVPLSLNSTSCVVLFFPSRLIFTRYVPGNTGLP